MVDTGTGLSWCTKQCTCPGSEGRFCARDGQGGHEDGGIGTQEIRVSVSPFAGTDFDGYFNNQHGMAGGGGLG
jgi:hypothetical protein